MRQNHCDASSSFIWHLILHQFNRPSPYNSTRNRSQAESSHFGVGHPARSAPVCIHWLTLVLRKMTRSNTRRALAQYLIHRCLLHSIKKFGLLERYSGIVQHPLPDQFAVRVPNS